MCWLNLKSVAFPVTEMIGGTSNIWAVPGYAPASFSPKFFIALQTDRQTDGRTDGQTDDMRWQYRALHYSASRGTNKDK